MGIHKSVIIIKNEDQNSNYISPAHRKFRVGNYVGPFTGRVYRMDRRGNALLTKLKRKKDMSIRDVIAKAETRQGLRYGWNKIRSISEHGGKGRYVEREISGKLGKFVAGHGFTVGKKIRTKKMGDGSIGLRVYESIPKKGSGRLSSGRKKDKVGRMAYRNARYSTKSLSKANSGQLSLDEVSSKIRTAFDEFFKRMKTGPEIQPVSTVDWHIDRIYPAYVIAAEGWGTPSKYLKISYKMDNDGKITFGKPQKVKMVFQVTKAGEVVGVGFQKAEKQSLKYGWESHIPVGGKRIFGIKGRQGYFQIRTEDGRVSGHRNRSVPGRKDDVWEHVRVSGKNAVLRRRNLYRKLGLSTKSL